LFDRQTRAFLESGCGLLVATVSPDGEPYASRGWGLDVLDAGPPARLRLLLDADDGRTLEHVAAGGAIAITAANVLTLRSIQLKGRARGLDGATSDDRARVERYVREFHADVEATDFVTWELFQQFFPVDCLACLIDVHEAFDQTPGPGAGARVAHS
jgi:Pyridoxamine 5'-phosphate oxidase